jgi:L-ascorbate metabolism protein UlaG (beta-lactamase superfamily)
MATIRRLTDSCLAVTTNEGTSLFDPGFHTFGSGEIDLDTIGEIQRIFVTHEHGDHVSPDFLRWLLDRGADVTVHANDAVRELLAPHDIAVETESPAGVTYQDVVHERIPTGARPPNRSWTISEVVTHPGDSYQPTESAPVLALPLLVPWGSVTASVEFARTLGPREVIPIHDFYTSSSGRAWVAGMAKNVLAQSGITLVPLDWGDSYSF